MRGVLSALRERIRPILAACDFGRPEQRTDDNGNPFYRVSATDPASSGKKPLVENFGFDRLTDVDITGTVSPQSVIVSLSGDLTFEGGDEGEALVQVEYETRAVGDTTVSKPSWVDSARDRAPRVEGSFAQNRHAIRFDHTGGEAVVPGTKVVINEYEGRGYHERPLQTPFESGQTLFAYIENGTLQVTRDALADDASPVRLASSDGHTALRLGSFNFFRSRLGEL